ncbi:hypothetical protein P22_1115 [Propionispora sp. 2/2-37]|nr:hypothetical protein P22_1115 [Propionispora sp. 2/2-37]
MGGKTYDQFKSRQNAKAKNQTGTTAKNSTNDEKRNQKEE